jgi:hypothetical protein
MAATFCYLGTEIAPEPLTRGKEMNGKKRILVIAITSRAETLVLTSSSNGSIRGMFDGVINQTQPA